MFRAALFILTKGWKQPKYPSTVELVNWDTHGRTLCNHEMRKNKLVTHNMNECENGEQKKQETRECTQYDSLHIKY